MKTIQRLFRREKEKRKLIVSERRIFKQDGYGFYIKKMEDGSVEFWAHIAQEYCPYEQSYFLGTWTDDDGLIKSPDYYQLRRWVQDGAQRLVRYMQGKSYGLYDQDD